MKVLDGVTTSSPLPRYLSCSNDVIGQSGVVVMPTTGALTSNVVYLCSAPDTYRQWVSPTMGQLIPAVGSGSNGHYPVAVTWPHLANYQLISSYANDWPQEMSLPTPALPRQVTTGNIFIFLCKLVGLLLIQTHFF